MNQDSNLYPRLGPQGRELYNYSNRGKLQNPYSYQTNNFKVPTQLDFLLNELIHPNDSTTPDKIFSYLAYYYPKLQNEHNVELLTEYFLRSPLFFGNPGKIGFLQTYKIIECFKFIIDKKFEISCPTLAFHTFYTAIYNGLRNLLISDPSSFWKILPVITGCLLSVDSRNTYNRYPEYFNVIRAIDDSMKNVFLSSFHALKRIRPFPRDMEYISIIYLSCIHDQLNPDDFIKILKLDPNLPHNLVKLLIDSSYGLQGGKAFLTDTPNEMLMNDSPVLKHLSRLSLLFNKLIELQEENDICLQNIFRSIKEIEQCSNFLFSPENCLILESFKDSSEKWKLLKHSFFAIIIIFEGISLKFYALDTNPTSFEFRPSSGIIHCLFHWSFVVDHIGTGGFASYNFVYDSTTNFLINFRPSSAESLTACMLNDISFGALLDKSEIQQSRLAFLLTFIESTINVLSHQLRFERILPFVESLLSSNTKPAIIESCHSVMLRYVELLELPMTNNIEDEQSKNNMKSKIFQYLSLSVSQFPSKLSLSQIGIIVETIGRAIGPGSFVFQTNPPIFKDILNLLYSLCLTSDYSMISNKLVMIEGEEQEQEERFKHRRPALCSLLIKLIYLAPLGEYLSWLNLIKFTLIDKTVEIEEKFMLYDCLWDSIMITNKYFPQKGILGIDWWYEYVNNSSITPNL